MATAATKSQTATAIEAEADDRPRVRALERRRRSGGDMNEVSIA
jgi:hypothetical protein